MDPLTLTGTALLLPLASALIIMLFHGVLKNAAYIISVGVSVIIFGCSCALLAAKDHSSLLLFPFLKIGEFSANISFVIDQQSKGMLFIVTFIGMLVHIYSVGYMHDDKAKARYFGALSLFMFSMIGIVLADNLVMMFLFWELVGLSSYLLIGHWFEKPEAADAAKKAFITNRIGDFGFMTGILILFGVLGVSAGGVLTFSEMKESLSAGSSGPLHGFAEQHAALFSVACIALFLGAVGKSAQAPLHVWLPDAMEGPTPVSALIHAATMVAAGVYMLVRIHFLIVESHVAGMVIAWTGGITALMAALMATQQNDIKKVLAYSTLSQLGYMVMSVGVAAPEAGMFHLYTHAFFKALLFLGSGAVIYACHHEQDIWKMGGLRHKMPATFWTFTLGTAALMGVPFLSGFWSKEGILAAAYEHHKLLFVIGVLTAGLTAFYMTRLWFVAFFGKARSEGASHAHEVPWVMLGPLVLLAVFSVVSGYGFVSGPLNALVPHGEHHGGMAVMVCSIIVLILGYLAASRLYAGRDKDPLNIPLFANKFYFDEIYAGIVKVAQDGVAWIVNGLEKIFIGGLTMRVPAALTSGLGNWMRRLQSGNLQGYTFVLGLGIIVAVYLAVFLTSKQ